MGEGRPGYRADFELFDREEQLRIEAGRVMQDLKDTGGDWQAAWRDHPVARAYRQLLKDAWARPVQR